MSTFGLVILVAVGILVAIGVLYLFLKRTEELIEAIDVVGDTYEVCKLLDGSLVAEFSTEWQAEAYLLEHEDEDLVISSPEERYEAYIRASKS